MDGPPSSEWRPIPDPTQLTTAAVDRLEAIITERFTSLDRIIQSKLDAAALLTKEKFNDMERRFGEMERYRVEQKTDTKNQVDYALNAVNERLAQLATNASTIADSLRRSIDENKERSQDDAAIRGRQISTVEQRIIAIESQKVGAKDNTSWIVAIGGVFLLLLAIMGWIASHNPPRVLQSESPHSGTVYEEK